MGIKRREKWQATLADLGAERGFYRRLGAQHSALFLRGDGTLVVSFDNLDDARQDMGERMPWGSSFISSRGWSSLGLGAHGWTWYRDDAVLDFFDELARDRFFDQFDTVVFYGTSMAGYAATAFCSAAPGARVVAMNPQATLDRALTSGWETRFHRSWRQDFSGRYGFGPDQALSAEDVYLFYDPMEVEDAMHAAFYQGDNIHRIRCTHMGHGLTSSLQRMGVLSELVTRCVTGRPTKAEILTLLRRRKTEAWYQRRILDQLKERGRPLLIHRYCRAVIDCAEGAPRPRFFRAMKEVENTLPNPSLATVMGA